MEKKLTINLVPETKRKSNQSFCMANSPVNIIHFLLHYELQMFNQCMEFSILLTFILPPAQLNQKRKQNVHEYEKHQLFCCSNRQHCDLSMEEICSLRSTLVFRSSPQLPPLGYSTETPMLKTGSTALPEQRAENIFK